MKEMIPQQKKKSPGTPLIHSPPGPRKKPFQLTLFAELFFFIIP